MKKIVSLILVATMILSMAVVPSYADGSKKFVPPGLAKKGGMPPGLAKKFMDIEEYDWARSAIEKMALKGIVKGVKENIFAPSRSVTKIEALAMIIRVMGWDEEADLFKKLIEKGRKEDRLKDKLQDWGKGYIELALEKELIDEVDLAQDNFLTPATRQEVAKYIIRALGKEEEAQKHMHERLRFRDGDAVQIGAVGYVYLIDQLGIMVGDTKNNFQPNKPVTRAEMAKLVERLDEKVDSDMDEDEAIGEIVNIDDDEIEIEVDGEAVEYDVHDDVIVYDIYGKKIDYDELEKGTTVHLYFYEDEVIYIQVIKGDEKKIISDFEGIVKDVDKDTIQVQVDRMHITFEVADRAVIKINGVTGDLEDIKEGDEAEVKVDDRNRAIAIYVSNDDVRSVEAKLLWVVNDDKIIVEVDQEMIAYKLADDVRIYIDNKREELDDLEENEKVELTVKDNEVTVIRWNSDDNNDDDDRVLEGRLISIQSGSRNRITLEIDDENQTFVVDEDVEIEIEDEEDADFADLFDEIGHDIEIEVEDNTVVKIEIED